MTTDTDNGFILRDARSVDLVRIGELEKQCFSVPWSADDFALFLGETAMENPLLCSIFTVCEDSDGKICGYICARRVFDECEILNVASAPSHRRMGIGRMLMTSVHEKMPSLGVTSVFLEVRNSNIPAQNLYRSLSYTEIGIRRAYYRAPIEDAILMRADIPKDQ